MTSRKREFYRQITASVESLERLIGEPVDEFENSLEEEGIRNELDTAEVYTDAVEELKALRSTLEGIQQNHLNDHGLAIFAKGLVASYADIGVSPATENSVEFEPFLVASIESIGDKIKEYGSKAWEAVKELAKRIKEWVLGLFKQSTDSAADDVKKAADEMKGQHDQYTDWDSVFNETMNEINRHYNRYNEPIWSGGDDGETTKQTQGTDKSSENKTNHNRQPKKIKYRNTYRGFIDEHGKFTMGHLDNFLKLTEVLNKVGVEIAKGRKYDDESAARFAEAFNAVANGVTFNGHKSYIHHDESRHSLTHMFVMPDPKIETFDEPTRADLMRVSHDILRLKVSLNCSPRGSVLLDLATDVLNSVESQPYLKDYVNIFNDVYKMGRLYILGLRAIMHACKTAKD